MAVETTELDQELHGLDTLEAPQSPSRPRRARVWSAAWPKLGAVALTLAIWQVVVWSGWKPDYLLPGPATVLGQLGQMATDGSIADAARTTLSRAVSGFALALVIGVVVGAVVSRVGVARSAFASLITGLQTMPSVAWVPLAILLFPFEFERAILFVVVLGAAPSIANGLISGVDHIPPLWLRAGQVLGARGLSMFRHVILPAALPSFVAGLKQGWAFAWRSLMAGELIVVVAGTHSLGADLHHAAQLNQAPRVLAIMMVILLIGILVDSLVFGQLDRALRRRRGLLDPAA